MFSNILTELKTLKEQNETFRNETKKDIEEIKAEIKGIDKNMVERCGSLETKINYVENNKNEKVTQTGKRNNENPRSRRKKAKKRETQQHSSQKQINR